jgi:hypothetical protein
MQYIQTFSEKIDDMCAFFPGWGGLGRTVGRPSLEGKDKDAHYRGRNLPKARVCIRSARFPAGVPSAATPDKCSLICIHIARRNKKKEMRPTSHFRDGRHD